MGSVRDLGVPKANREATSVSLDLREGSLLATAMCGHIIRTERLRAVVIKGPIATRWGLRPQRPSGDVDILTDLDGEVALMRILAVRGWRRRPTDSSEIVPAHSSTLYHPSWNVDIDIHTWYPGCEADRDDVLRRILSTSVQEHVAGVSVPVPGVAAMAVIQALHSLRSPWLSQSRADLAHLLASPDLPDFASVFEFAEATEATGALRPFLEAAYGDQLLDRPIAEPSAEWTSRLGERVPGLLRWRAIRRATGRRRLTLIYRAVIPSRETMASRDLRLAQGTAASYWLAVWRRIVSFLRWLVVSQRRR